MAPSTQNHAYALIEPEYIHAPIDHRTRHQFADVYAAPGDRRTLDLTYAREEEAPVGPIRCAPLLPVYKTKATALRRGDTKAGLYECDSVLAAYVDVHLLNLAAMRNRWFAWIPAVAIDDMPLYHTLAEARAAQIGHGQVVARVYDREPTVPPCDANTIRLLPGRIRARQQSRERAFAKYFLKEMARYSSTPIFGKKPLSLLPPEWATNQMRLMRETFDFRPDFDYDPAAPAGYTGLNWAPKMDLTAAIGARQTRLEIRKLRTFPGRGWRLAPEVGSDVLNRYNYRWVQKRNRT